MKRFDIMLVGLDPTIGSEIRKTRPCVILSPLEMLNLRTVLVAPMTSQGFAAPFRPGLNFDGTPGLILLDQIRAVDKQRLIKKLGTLSPAKQKQVLAALAELFAP